MSRRVVEVVVKMKDQASKGLDKFSDKIGISKGALLGLAAAGAIVGTALVKAFNKAVGAAKALIQQTAEAGDELDKMSTRTSVAVESLAEWVFLMERAGGNAGTLEAGVRRLTRSMFDNTRGVKESVDAWNQLGISVTDADGELKDVDDVLLELGDALEKMENQTEALGLSQSILGRGAAQMVALLAQGRPELEKQRDLFREINGEMSVEFTKGAAAVIDAEGALQTAIKGLKADLLEPIQPVLADTIEKVAKAVGELGEFVEDNQDIVGEWAEDLADATQNLVQMNLEFARFTVENGPEFTKFMKIAKIATGDFSGVIRNLTEDTKELNEEVSEATKGFNDMTAAFEKMAGGDIRFEAFEQIKEVPELLKDLSFVPNGEEDLVLLGELNDGLAQYTQQTLDFLEVQREQAEINQTIDDGLMDLRSSFESMGSSALSSFLQGSNQAIMFGRMLKTVVLDALSQVITKLLIIKALSVFSGGILGKDGGTMLAAGGMPKKMAGGGGFSVTTGAPGRDVVPALLQRGENVTDRTLSQQLKGFLDSQNSASIVSPFDLAASGSGNVSVSLNLARPYGVIDAMDLGRSVVTAVESLSEANL